MFIKTIGELPLLTSPSSVALLPIQDGGVTYKISRDNMGFLKNTTEGFEILDGNLKILNTSSTHGSEISVDCPNNENNNSIALASLYQDRRGLWDSGTQSWLLYSRGYGSTATKYFNGTAGTANYISTPSTNGYYTNQYGNFFHSRSDTSDFFRIQDNSDGYAFSVNFENHKTYCHGLLQADGLQMVLDTGVGALSLGGVSAGFISTGQKQLYFYIPLGRPVKATPTLNNLSVVARHADGGYLYVRSGTGGTVYTALGTNLTPLWTNGAATRTNEISSLVLTTTYEGLLVNINFNYQICKANDSTVAITNNIPVALQVTGSCTF